MASPDDLPNEMLIKIFSYMNIIERQRFSGVCKRWQSNINQIFIIHKLKITYVLKKFKYEINICISDDPKIEIISNNISYLTTILKQNCGNLKGLDLCIETDSTERLNVLRELIKHNQHLNSVRISYFCNNQFGELLEYLNTEHLQHLILKYPYHCLDSLKFYNAVEKVLRKADKLSFLFIHGITPSMMRIITEKNTLKSLYSECVNDITAINGVAQLSNLEVISINYSRPVNNRLLIGLANNCKKLHTIEFGGCSSITHNGLNAIESLSNLRSLRLTLPQNTQILNYFSNLEEIYCNLCLRPTREILTFLRRSPNMKRCYFDSDDGNDVDLVTKIINERFKNIVTEAGFEIDVSPPSNLLDSEWDKIFNAI